MAKNPGEIFRTNPKEVQRRDDAPNRVPCLILLLTTLLVTTAVWAQGLVYQVGVDGLSCPFCAYGIEKQLNKLQGTKQVEVDIANGQVVVSMDEGKTLEKAQVIEAIKKSGFSMRSFEQVQGDTEK